MARGGDDAARTAATAAYTDATVDIARARDYNDPVVAEAYLQAAGTHDYYVANGTVSTYRTELENAVNAPLDGDDDF